MLQRLNETEWRISTHSFILGLCLEAGVLCVIIAADRGEICMGRYHGSQPLRLARSGRELTPQIFFFSQSAFLLGGELQGIIHAFLRSIDGIRPQYRTLNVEVLTMQQLQLNSRVGILC